MNSTVRYCFLYNLYEKSNEHFCNEYYFLGDVKTFEGEDIPFKRLGFCSLEEMLRKIDNIEIVSYNRRPAVKVLPTAETNHIAAMVNRQKPKKKKSRTVCYNNNRKYDCNGNYMSVTNHNWRSSLQMPPAYNYGRFQNRRSFNQRGSMPFNSNNRFAQNRQNNQGYFNNSSSYR